MKLGILATAALAAVVGCGAGDNVPATASDMAVATPDLTPIAITPGVSVHYDAGQKTSTDQSCDGGCLICLSTSCHMDLEQQARPGSQSAFVDVWQGPVTISDATSTKMTPGVKTRLALCPQSLSTGATFSITMGIGAKIGAMGYSVGAVPPTGCP